MSNTKKVLELVNDHFTAKGFRSNKTSFQKSDGLILKFLDLEALAGGYRLEVTYGIYIKKFNLILSKVLDTRDIKRTIYVRGEVAFADNAKFQRMKLENELDIKNAALLVIEIYELFAKSFFEKNNSLPQILKSLRAVNGIAVPLGNLIHSLMANEAMALDLFLTRLLYQEADFAIRCNHYREVILNLSRQYKIEKGIEGAYMHMIEMLDIEADKIMSANWDEIKGLLADLL